MIEVIGDLAGAALLKAEDTLSVKHRETKILDLLVPQCEHRRSLYCQTFNCASDGLPFSDYRLQLFVPDLKP